jgi:hypothetical protein
MKMLRLYSGDSGESHFDDVEFPMMLRDAAPPAQPVYFTQPASAVSWASVKCPPNWDGGLHPAPQRQILVCTAGSLRMTSSLGDQRDLVPGSAIFVEDTTGKGHISEVTSSIPFEALVIRLE